MYHEYLVENYENILNLVEIILVCYLVSIYL